MKMLCPALLFPGPGNPPEPDPDHPGTMRGYTWSLDTCMPDKTVTVTADPSGPVNGSVEPNDLSGIILSRSLLQDSNPKIQMNLNDAHPGLLKLLSPNDSGKTGWITVAKLSNISQP